VAVLDFLAGALASRESHFTKPKQQSDGRSSLATQPTWILDDLALLPIGEHRENVLPV
jgi:hypothetical protein